MSIIKQNGIDLALPAGISFYTFESMSFIIDVYKRKIIFEKNKFPKLDFFAFIGMFPRFIAGPIVRFSQIGEQFKSYSGMRIELGIVTFIYGLALKVLFADQFAHFVPLAFSNGEPSTSGAWLGLISYSMQIYFDFSGYSKMAIGLGQMMGFDFPENFNRPYLSSSLSDFWQRWHISLSSWLKDYLYISLGGNKVQPWRMYLNIFVTMLIGGLWHGSSITFVIWGCWHGLFLCLDKSILKRYVPSPLVGWILTTFLVFFGWIFFRATDLNQVVRIFKSLLFMSPNTFSLDPFWQKPVASLLSLFGIVYCYSGEVFCVSGLKTKKTFSIGIKIAAFFVFIVSLNFIFSSESIPFMYFQF